MNPENPKGASDIESVSALHLPTEKATRAQRVRRVYDRKEMEDYCRNWIRKNEGINFESQEGDDKITIERAKRGVETICQDMRERIYWGLYSDWNELLRLTEIRDIEELTGEDAIPYQKLLLKGLKEDPPAFGAKFDEEVKKLETDEGIEQIADFIDSRYVAGVKHTYMTAEGQPKERIVGFGLLDRKTGAESHKGYAGRLYVHKAHQGRGISRSIILHLFDKAESLGLKHVDAVVVASNKWLRQYYARIGFRDMRTEYDAVEIDGTSYDWVHIRLDMDTYRQNRSKL